MRKLLVTTLLVAVMTAIGCGDTKKAAPKTGDKGATTSEPAKPAEGEKK